MTSQPKIYVAGRRLNASDWQAKVGLEEGLTKAYTDFLTEKE